MNSQLDSLQRSLDRILLKIRQCREAAKLSQSEVAEKLSIGLRTYQRIENGEVSCDISFLYRFSEVLNINFIDLVTPYPPAKKMITLYKSEIEIKSFEALPFIQKTNFNSWVKRFEKDLLKLGETEKFINEKLPMSLWTHSKKIVNNSHHEFFDTKKGYQQINNIYLKPDDRVNTIDCLFCYRPKYSLKKLIDYNVKGIYLNLNLYSAHLYVDEEILSISVVELDT